MYRENRNIDFVEIQDFPEESLGNRKTEKGEPGNSNDPGVKEKKKIRIKELIDGTILVRENMIRQLPYVIFLTALGIIYIGNRFHAERMVRQINDLKIEVNNLRSEQITTTSELMNISRPSEVSELVQSRNIGLKESTVPPKKLIRK
jgi:hypothetical protein